MQISGWQPSIHEAFSQADISCYGGTLMTETKYYEINDFRFEFTPDGSPYQGVLVVRNPELEPYTAEINLPKSRSCTEYANRASKLCGMGNEALQAALNSV